MGSREVNAMPEPSPKVMIVVTTVKFGECLGEVADQMREQDALHASRPSFPDLLSIN
jgi:hypothetical protein